MYSDKLVVAVKHNGRVLRENGDTVLIPFGSEYTLYFKNLNSVRALVRVSIDGEDATKGVSLIIEPNHSFELERFLDASNLDKGHRFKFIERTKKIEDGPRGVKAEDGLIRVEFEFERAPAKIEDVYVRQHRIYDYWPYWGGPIWVSRPITAGDDHQVFYTTSTQAAPAVHTPPAAKTESAFRSASKSDDLQAQNVAQAVNDVGITVPGSVSHQQFQLGAWFQTDGQKHVMVLRLLGQVGETKVEAPVTVKTKLKCPTCGTLNKHGTKFCRECGTGLTAL
jgi:hypothetical protein